MFTRLAARHAADGHPTVYAWGAPNGHKRIPAVADEAGKKGRSTTKGGGGKGTLNLVGRVTRVPRRRSWHGQALKEMHLDSSPGSVHAWQENVYFRDQSKSLRNHTSTGIPEISFNLLMKSAISRARDARMRLLWTLLSTCPRYVWSISLSFRVGNDNRQASTSPHSDE